MLVLLVFIMYHSTHSNVNIGTIMHPPVKKIQINSPPEDHLILLLVSLLLVVALAIALILFTKIMDNSTTAAKPSSNTFDKRMHLLQMSVIM